MHQVIVFKSKPRAMGFDLLRYHTSFISTAQKLACKSNSLDKFWKNDFLLEIAETARYCQSGNFVRFADETVHIRV